MKHIKIILSLSTLLSLTNIAISQKILIHELPVNRNDALLTEIESRLSTMVAHKIDVNKDVLFTNDSVFQVIIDGNTNTFSKGYINVRNINSFSFYGKNDESLILISFHNGDIQGYASIRERTYAIETFQNHYFMIQKKLVSLQDDCGDLDYSIGENPNQILQRESENLDTGSINDPHLSTRSRDGIGDIKVLVLYTADAASSVSDIVNTAYVAEELSNISFSNSGINCKIEIVYIGETNYQEVGSSTDVDRYKRTNDGYIDEVHSLREKYAADVCVLLTDYHNTTCGRAYTIKALREEAFCVVQAYDCATNNLSFAHEIGHLIGCRHEPQSDGNTSPYVYGHGYIYPNGGWRTIMAYYTYCNGCERKPYWSNPEVTYNGVPMGNSDCCNNARVWNVRYGEVGNFENVANNVTISSNAIPGSLNYGFIEAGSDVATNGNVSLQNGQMLTIKAGGLIVLEDGFEALIGSELKAFISPQSTMLSESLSSSSIIDISPVRRMEIYDIGGKVVIYPNPTADKLYIKTNEKPSKIILMDVLGRIVNNMDYSDVSIDLSGFPAGIYFVDFVFSNRIERYRIIKK